MEFSNYATAGPPATYSTAPPNGHQQQQMQPQVIFIQAPKFVRSFDRYASRWSCWLGWIQIFCGIMSIILGIANPLVCGLYGFIGIGIWAGILYIISGVFGIISAQRKTSHTIITHMVLSVISAACAAIQVALSATSAFWDGVPPIGCYYYQVVNQEFINNINNSGTIAVDSLLAIFAIVQGIVAILASAISCKVICCSSHFVQDQGFATDGQQRMAGLPAGAVVTFSNSAPPHLQSVQNNMARPYNLYDQHDDHDKNTVTIPPAYTTVNRVEGIPSLPSFGQTAPPYEPLKD